MSNLVYPSLPGLKWDVRRSPIFATLSHRTASLKNATLALASYPLWQFELQYEVLRDYASFTELSQLLGIFCSMLGQYDTFLFTDPHFNTVASQQIGIGDSSNRVFQLTRTVGAGSFLFVEPVQNVNTLTDIRDNGVVVNGANYSVSTTGVVTFTVAPVTGHVITWNGTYYFRCQFLTDSTEFNEMLNLFYEARQIKFISYKS